MCKLYVDETEKLGKSISIANQFFSIYWCNATPIANLFFHDCVEIASSEQQQRNMFDDHHVRQVTWRLITSSQSSASVMHRDRAAKIFLEIFVEILNRTFNSKLIS